MTSVSRALPDDARADGSARRIDVRRASFAPRPPLTDRVPFIAAASTALVAVVNLASALTPDLPGRVRTLLALAPMQQIEIAHALALPVGLALAVSSWSLARGSRVAARTAVALLFAAGVLNLLKGLDVEEAALSFAAAGLLWRCRDAFAAPPSAPATLRRSLVWCALLAAGAFVAGAAASLAWGDGSRSFAGTIGALQLLTGTGPALLVPPWLEWLPGGIQALGLAVALASLLVLFAPARLALRGAAGEVDRLAAAAVGRQHGTGTLGAFSLRSDLARAWSEDGEAFIAYRVEAGTLLMAGDPVGREASHGAALDAAIAIARLHGLAIGGVAAGDAFARVARSRGMRRLYLGDESILPTGALDLSGGARKSLRKAVNRIERNGYTAALRQVGDLDAAALAELEHVSALWRDGSEERGFSMGHDTLSDVLLPDATVVVARDETGAVRGFLHFVPVFGRPQASLAFMRRDRDTPNGLSDFLVVRAAALMAQAGVEELSLNFAPFGGLRREPAHIGERLIVRFLLAIDGYFKLGGLEHFNAKFDPRWQPRHLVFQSPAALPRVLLAAIWAEGLMPKPALPAGEGHLRGIARGRRSHQS